MKKVIMLSLAVLFGLAVSLSVTPADVQAESKFVTIGTGGVTGVYYPTGGAIADGQQDQAKNTASAPRWNPPAVRCSTSTPSWPANSTFGVAQSDRQYQAVQGIEDWKDKGPPEGSAGGFFHPSGNG